MSTVGRRKITVPRCH